MRGDLGDSRVGEHRRSPAAMARAASPSCTTFRATARLSIHASRAATASAARPVSATPRCTAPTVWSTASSVVDRRTTARPGGPPRTARYKRRSLVDALSRWSLPTPASSAARTSGRVA